MSDGPLRRGSPGAQPWPAQETWELWRAGIPVGRASLWWRQTPPAPGQSPDGKRPGPAPGAAERTGAIGELEAEDDAAAHTLLRQACRRLREQGCGRVLAPLDGNTWQAYRCRADAGLGFPGEPQPGPEWIARLQACGFRISDRYLSSRCGDLQRRRPGPERQQELGRLRLEPLQALSAAGPGGAERLIQALHPLVQEGFRRQPHFLPLSAEALGQQLLQRGSGADPQLSLLALAGERPVGLLLGQRWRDGLVVRTLVVAPERPWAGLGRLLLESAHARAHALGCRQAWHGLMHEHGPGWALSRHYGDAVSGCLLLARDLRDPGSARPL
ncbi:MAG: GNAT family N-acetyltransferase [Synechococcaceae cyanobacterium]|nr:GNAT family N-acetyltransferase [Synechococcaceae cyanobacterium]